MIGGTHEPAQIGYLPIGSTPGDPYPQARPEERTTMNFDRLNPRRTTVDDAAAARDQDVPPGTTAVARDTTVVERPVVDRPVVDRPVVDRDTRIGRDATIDRDTRVDRDATIDRDRPVVDRDPALDGPDADVPEVVVPDRRSVVAREREAFGGVKIGSAFFGWLTATGTAVLLTAFVAAGGTAVGVLNGNSVSNPDFGVTWRGVRGAVVIIAVLFIAYFCGGYVAGRMARFNGLKQGVAVFVWAIVVALLVAALGALAGTQWDALSTVTGVPRFSTGPARVTSDGMLVGFLAVAGALVGSLLGGLAGMRFHRRVDRAGWATPVA